MVYPTSRDEKQRYLREGYEAFVQGRNCEENPYEGWGAMDWEDGYLDARSGEGC